MLIGVGQFLNDYTGIKGRPNAKLYFDPSKGFNAGALTLHEYTRNSSGIGAGQEILLSHGVGYDLTMEPKTSTSYAARLKGPLADFAAASTPKLEDSGVSPLKKQKVTDVFSPEAAMG